MTARAGAVSLRAGRWLVWAVVLVPPFLLSPTAEDAFRLPKLAATEILAMLSLAAFAGAWWTRRRVPWRALASHPAVVFALLLAAAAAPGAVAGAYAAQWQRAAVSLGIALACLAAWSLHLGRDSLRRAIELLVVPAVALALLVILQAHQLWNPFAFVRGQGVARFGLTSLAGSVGDLAAYLVLPVLALEAGLTRRAAGARARLARALALLVLLYALFLSQTLAALAAAAVGSVVLWALLLPAPRRWLLAAPLLVAAAGVALVPRLERRLEVKWEQLLALELHELLSGRPDAWKVALELFRGDPFFGVGHGGFGASYAAGRLDLIASGMTFRMHGENAHFANAHNEYLEALAEWGLWGAVALAAAGAVLVRRLGRLWRTAEPEESALAIAGCVALATLAAASFPLRIALTAYPWILFGAWVFTEREPAAGLDVAAARGQPKAGARAAGTPRRKGGGGAPRTRRTLDSRRATAVAPGGVGSAAGSGVPGWTLAAIGTAAALGALALHGRTLLGRLEASRILRTTTQVAQLAMGRSRGAARPALQANLRPLRRAAELDPAEVAVPMAIGSHYLLLENPAAAREAYQHALAIEPRANLYLNLARVLWLEGRRDEARELAATAVALDAHLADEAEPFGVAQPRG